MKSKTTPKTSKKAAKKATRSPKGAPPAKSNEDGKPGEKGAHTATPARTAAPSKRSGSTLAELADSYLAHLEEIGKSPATIFSYKMDLAIARAHFGDETPVGSLTPEKVAGFFSSDAVTKKKGGENKTQVTVDKTRRVLRQALVIAVEKRMIETAPLPASRKDDDACSR